MKTPSNPVKTARAQLAQTRTLNSSFANAKFKHTPTNDQTNLVDFGVIYKRDFLGNIAVKFWQKFRDKFELKFQAPPDAMPHHPLYSPTQPSGLGKGQQ